MRLDAIFNAFLSPGSLAEFGRSRLGARARLGLGSVLLSGVVALAGCGPSASGDRELEAALAEAQAFRAVDDVSVGQGLYAMHCAECHGAERQGAPQWWQRDADGRFGPPALDGSAHSWHHPPWQLRDMIRHGSAVGLVGTEHLRAVMPAFGTEHGGPLSDADVDALIAYIVTGWPDEVYMAWLDYVRRDPTQARWSARNGAEWALSPELLERNGVAVTP